MALARLVAGRALRPVLGSTLPAATVGGTGAARTTTFQPCRRESTEPIYIRYKKWPLVARFRKWYGYDQPLFDLSNYPNLPRVHMNELPEWGWQDNYDRRNFNTLYHDDFDILSDWNYDTYAPDKVSHLERRYTALFVLLAGWGSVYVFLWLCKFAIDNFPEFFVIRSPGVSKQFPHGNLYIERGGDMRFKDGYFPSGPAFYITPERHHVTTNSTGIE